MKDIAEKLDISINAVSLALNDRAGVSDETRALIIKTASELCYFDENPTFAFITKNICLLIESRYFKDIYFYSKVILGIESEAKKNNYDIIVNFMEKTDFKIPSCIENRKVSGILIIGTIKDEYLKEINSYNIPVVLVDHASHIISTDAILTQNMPGAYIATQHLIDKGHKDIGFFGSIDYSLSFKERWLGFYECMRRSRLYSGLLMDVLSEYSITGRIEKLIDEKDYSAIKGLFISLKRAPTAWVCANDAAAISLYYTLSGIGMKMPDDFSIVGFDDIDLCNIITPHLTTIRVNKELMGQKAVKRLIWRMENKGEPFEQIRMEVSLVERGSVRNIT